MLQVCELAAVCMSVEIKMRLTSQIRGLAGSLLKSSDRDKLLEFLVVDVADGPLWDLVARKTGR